MSRNSPWHQVRAVLHLAVGRRRARWQRFESSEVAGKLKFVVGDGAASQKLRHEVRRRALGASTGQVDRCGAVPDSRIAEQTTLKQILARYRDEVSPKKRSSQSEQLRIDAIIRRSISHRTLALLTSADLARYRDERREVVSPATVIRELITISHAIDTARREWGIHLVENPVKLVKRPAAPNGRTRRLADGEEQDLLEAADRGRCLFIRPLIILALETAARRGELLGLLWSDIDLKRRVAHLPLTKNGSARDIPLSSRATETLRALAARRCPDTDHVFPMSGNAVRLAWERLRQRAGIVDLHFHDLRHEAVSRLFEKGLDMMAVAAISGHKTLSMLSRYTHLRAVDLVARLDERQSAPAPMSNVTTQQASGAINASHM